MWLCKLQAIILHYEEYENTLGKTILGNTLGKNILGKKKPLCNTFISS